MKSIDIGLFLYIYALVCHFLSNFKHIITIKYGKQGYNNRIRAILSDKQITNRVLADMINVSEMTIYRWVTNRYQPYMSQFVEISKKLNVDIKELIEVNP